MGELDDESKKTLKPKYELSNKEKFFYSTLFIGLNGLIFWILLYIGFFKS